eukprot:1320009-Pyramimonas_sp.AAC.1
MITRAPVGVLGGLAVHLEVASKLLEVLGGHGDESPVDAGSRLSRPRVASWHLARDLNHVVVERVLPLPRIMSVSRSRAGGLSGLGSDVGGDGGGVQVEVPDGDEGAILDQLGSPARGRVPCARGPRQLLLGEVEIVDIHDA